MRTQDYNERLRKVRDFCAGDYRTAREIAKYLNCTKMTAYTLIRVLEERGVKFKTELHRNPDQVRGPEATAYRVKSSPAIR